MGVHQVISQIGNQLTIGVNSPSTQVPTPAGSLTVEQADFNIELTGGTWDWNNTALTAPADASWKAHCLMFNKVGALNLNKLSVVNGGKYAIALQNCAQPTARDIFINSTSDGFHLNGNIWGCLIDGLSGTSSDDFLPFTGNDPAGYPTNRLPMNTGAVMADGSIMGTADSWGELVGLIARNIRPFYKNMRILIQPSSAYECSGILIDGYQPNFENSTNGGTITVDAEPFAGATTTIKDITIRNWTIGGARGTNAQGDAYFTMQDLVGGGPFVNQLVIDSLVFDRVITRAPLQAIASPVTGNHFFDGINFSQWSIGHLTMKDCKFDIDTTIAPFDIFGIAVNNANGEYLNQLTIDNCDFRQVAGTNVCRVVTHGGSTGSRIKSVHMKSCFVDSLVTSTFEVYQIGNQGLTGKPPIMFSDNNFKSVRFVFGATTDTATIIARGNYLQAAVYTDFIYGTGAAAHNIIWQANTLASGLNVVDSGVSGFTVIDGDATCKVDITKVTRTQGSRVVHNGATAAGTIPSGALCTCDGTGTTGSWSTISGGAIKTY